MTITTGSNAPPLDPFPAPRSRLRVIIGIALEVILIAITIGIIYATMLPAIIAKDAGLDRSDDRPMGRMRERR